MSTVNQQQKHQPVSSLDDSTIDHLTKVDHLHSNNMIISDKVAHYEEEEEDEDDEIRPRSGNNQRKGFLQNDNNGGGGGAVEEDEIIDVRMTVQQGSFLPIMCMIERSEIDLNTYVIDANTGAKFVHYTGHFGNLKALRVLVELHGVKPEEHQDSYKLTVAHYAARSGELEILIYLSRVSQQVMGM